MPRISIIPSLPALTCVAGVMLAVLCLQAAPAQQEADGLLGGAALFGNTSGPDVDVEISAVLKTVDGGRTEIQVTALVPDGYYIYSMNPSFTGATKITLLDTGSLTASKPQWQADHEPKAVFEKDLDQTVEKFFGSVTWSTTLEGTADPSTVVTGKLSGLYCSSPEFGGNGECVPVRNRKFTAALAEPASPPQSETTPVTDVAPAADAPHITSTDKNPVAVIPKIGYGKASKEGMIRFEIGLTPQRPQIGDEVTLSIRTVLEDPWHTFALDQDPDMAGQPTTIEFGTMKGLEPIGDKFTASVEPEIERPLDDIVQRVHFHEVTWSHRFTLSDSTAELDGVIRFQVCSNGSCLPPGKAEFALTLTAGQLDSAVDDTTLTPGPAGSKRPAIATAANAENEDQKEGFFAFVFTAAAAGFLALLTPCVFPMIPVTVAFFLKQEEKRVGSSIRLAIIYSLSIIGAFTVLGLITAGIFGPASLNTLANNKWLNLFFAALFLMFALMLIGVFEIQIPSSVLTWTSKRESTGGVIGVVFMALTFTLVSFTCTFAFVGSLLAWAAKGQVFWPVVGMLAFSSAFASPFFLLALFPSMLKRLPRSGGWMNDVKVTMGIVELALVVKFLSVADIGFSVGSIPVYITYRIFLVTWIALSVATGIYLLGLFRQPTGPLSSTVKSVRSLFAVLFLAFAGYVTAGMFVHKMPLTAIWHNVAAFAPPDVAVRNTEAMGFVISHHEMDYALEFEKATAAAEKEQRPIFIDFTGVNCVNCRKMERSVLIDEAVLERLDQLVRAQLYTDFVPGIRDKEFAEKLIVQNQDLQASLVGDVTLPFYAVISADGKKVLSLSKGLDRSGGKDFVTFLDKGLKEWESQKKTSIAARDVVTGD
ncbi:MAG: thioredoxin family protein [Fuerstia sp.]|nr:thioredoxin family protein [Fuerstiella sp.]